MWRSVRAGRVGERRNSGCCTGPRSTPDHAFRDVLARLCGVGNAAHDPASQLGDIAAGGAER